MLIGYYELNDGFKICGPYQTEYEDFQNYWRHLPSNVRQINLVTEKHEHWIWIRGHGWKKI